MKSYIECIHSLGQHLRKFMGTKEICYIRKESNSHRICLEHQRGRLSLCWNINMAAVTSCEDALSVTCRWANGLEGAYKCWGGGIADSQKKMSVGGLIIIIALSIVSIVSTREWFIWWIGLSNVWTTWARILWYDPQFSCCLLPLPQRKYSL